MTKRTTRKDTDKPLDVPDLDEVRERRKSMQPPMPVSINPETSQPPVRHCPCGKPTVGNDQLCPKCLVRAGQHD